MRSRDISTVLVAIYGANQASAERQMPRHIAGGARRKPLNLRIAELFVAILSFQLRRHHSAATGASTQEGEIYIASDGHDPSLSEEPATLLLQTIETAVRATPTDTAPLREALTLAIYPALCQRADDLTACVNFVKRLGPKNANTSSAVLGDVSIESLGESFAALARMTASGIPAKGSAGELWGVLYGISHSVDINRLMFLKVLDRPVGDFLCDLRAVTAAIVGLTAAERDIILLASVPPVRLIFVPTTPPTPFDAELTVGILEKLCEDLLPWSLVLPWWEAFDRILDQCPSTLIKDGDHFRSQDDAHIHCEAALMTYIFTKNISIHPDISSSRRLCYACHALMQSINECGEQCFKVSSTLSGDPEVALPWVCPPLAAEVKAKFEKRLVSDLKKYVSKLAQEMPIFPEADEEWGWPLEAAESPDAPTETLE